MSLRTNISGEENWNKLDAAERKAFMYIGEILEHEYRRAWGKGFKWGCASIALAGVLLVNADKLRSLKAYWKTNETEKPQESEVEDTQEET